MPLRRQVTERKLRVWLCGYLKLLNRLNSVVIENALLGIRSTKSADLRCIAVTTYLDREYLKEQT